jgi:protein TonB
VKESGDDFPEENVALCRDPSGGFLRDCLVGGDPLALASARRLRHKALLISLALEAVLLAALVLQPLVATGERPARLQMTPVPPWYGPHVTTRSNPGSSGPRHSAVNRPNIIYRRPQIPHSVPVPSASSERGDAPGAEESIGPGDPSGPLPPLGNNCPGLVPVIPAPVPPPAEHKNRVIRTAEVQEALLLHRVQPVYPLLAVQTRIEGRVQLRAIIGRDGAVKSLEAIDGHPVLARAALEAVSQWRYRPTLLNGVPVEVDTYITVIFQLQR